MSNLTQKIGWLIAALLAGALAAPLAVGAQTTVPRTVRASVDGNGVEANAASSVVSLSRDGRFVAFASGAGNLVPGDTNAMLDVFVHDLQIGTTERVSVTSLGAEARGASQAPAISGDGLTVAFVSSAGDLVANDTNGRLDVFVHSRASGVTERVSLAFDGTQSPSDSFAPHVSADGMRVVFVSSAPGLVPDDTNNTFDVFVRDRAQATTARVSVDSTGVGANGASLSPRISADGLMVAFQSTATNLVAGDANLANDVFVHDLATGLTTLVSVSSDAAGGPANRASTSPSLSADGRFVTFNSDATNLIASDTNARTDVFVRDRVDATTARVSVGSGAVESNGQSGFSDPASLSSDGRFISFTSAATNLIASDGNNATDVFVHDRATGTTGIAHVASDGAQADAGTQLWSSLSGDARAVAFVSIAANLVANDVNFVADAFVRTVACGEEMAGGDCPPPPAAGLSAMQCGKARSFGKGKVLPHKARLADLLTDAKFELGGATSLCTATPAEGAKSSGATQGPSSSPMLVCHRAEEMWSPTKGKHSWSKSRRFKVSIENDYGTQALVLEEPNRLCLPAGDDAAPAADAMDHFLCYPVEGVAEAREGALHKGKEPRRDNHPRPLMVCSPASLDGAPVVNAQQHFACYKRAATGGKNGSARAGSWRWETVHLKFGNETLEVRTPHLDCVPSGLTVVKR